MKVYVVYESLYGELLQDSGDSTHLIGVYSDMKKAKNVALEIVNSDIEDDYVLDNENGNFCDNHNGLFRLFWNNQGNTDCYYEIIIKEKEVQ